MSLPPTSSALCLVLWQISEGYTDILPPFKNAPSSWENTTSTYNGYSPGWLNGGEIAGRLS